MFLQQYQKVICLMIIGFFLTVVNLNPFYLKFEPSLILANSLNAVIFQPPPDDSRPDDTSGAGSRNGGQCPQDSIITSSSLSQKRLSMMALVPTTGYGLTVSERPTFWIYLPETSARQVVLSVKEGGITHHGQTFISVSGKPGIIGFKLEENISPLELEKWYQWAVVLVCGEKPNLNDPVVTAWVRRVSMPNSTSPLSQQSTDLGQAAWYGQQGIWYDTLTALARAKQAEQNNSHLTEAWVNLLNSVGLEKISTQPLQF